MKYTEKLARIILVGIYIAIGLLALKYFGGVISYIILGLVVALIAKPLMMLLRKVKIKGKSAPDTLLTVISILFILLVLVGLISGLVPVFAKVISNITTFSSGDGIDQLSAYMANMNQVLIDTFKLKPDFKMEVRVLNSLDSLLSVNVFGNVIGTLASAFAGIGVGLFASFFIAFFLIKDEELFPKILTCLSPERHTEHVMATFNDIEHLLSRYFVGLIIEMSCVGLVDFIGLWAVARLDFESALGIGFMAGMLNIIPYLGPLFGGIMGGIMAIVVKFCGPVPVGLDLGFWPFLLVLVAVFATAQLLDNIVLQPVIYSTSIQAHPLEIFIVMLLAGEVGGMVGMLLAIPGYTVVRVFAIHFLPNAKIVQALIHGKKNNPE